LIGVSMLEAGRRGVMDAVRRGEVATGLESVDARKGVELMGGAHMAVT
jgi:hypothetical protein